MKLKIELPEKLETALDLFCQVCEKVLAEPKPTMAGFLAETVAPSTEKPSLEDVPPGKTKEAPKKTNVVPVRAVTPKPQGVPDDKTFASLGLPEMLEIMKDWKNFSGFRFKALAKCARQVYAGLAPEDNPVNQLVEKINSGGINAILKGKHKDQAKAFIDGVAELSEPKDSSDGIDF